MIKKEENETFKAAITTELGCVEFLKEELNKRFKVDSIEGENWVSVNSSIEKIAEIMYMSQLAKRVVLLIGEGTFSDIVDLQENTKKSMENSTLLNLIDGKTTRITCDRTGSHDFNSLDAEQAVMLSLKEDMKNRKKEITLNLNNPEVIIYLRIVENKYLLGLDVAGRELSKRQHLVFNNASAIKGTIGFAALMCANYKPGQLILDPFSLSGNIMLEAALYESNTPVNFYTKKFTLFELKEFKDMVDGTFVKIDSKIKSPPSKPNIISSDASFNNISAQKKNAKIAGIDKFIACSRTDVHNLDIKTFVDRLDVVCARLPELSNNLRENQVRNIYSTMFKNLKYIIKKKSTLVFIVRNPEILEHEAEKEGFKEECLKQVWQGQQPFFLVKFTPTKIDSYDKNN
ncbi:MAG: THUMP domain-containing protein [Candidatus Woesearchaeota archaeon]